MKQTENVLPKKGGEQQQRKEHRRNGSDITEESKNEREISTLKRIKGYEQYNLQYEYKYRATEDITK